MTFSEAEKYVQETTSSLNVVKARLGLNIKGDKIDAIKHIERAFNFAYDFEDLKEFLLDNPHEKSEVNELIKKYCKSTLKIELE